MKAAVNLHKRKCVPCDGGVSPMMGVLLRSYMKKVRGWNLENGGKISKEYRFADDSKAVLFLKKIATASIKEGHHPAATWVYNKVRIEMWTHAVGGLSVNDFIMAAKFDEIHKKL
jgi:4a-hydroxytetrahydrobiopterin dehydratase